MTGLLEEKDNIGSVKDVSLTDMTITGYLAHFGSLDYNNDIIEKGAFLKTIQERGRELKFLNHHDFKQPHNRFDVLKEDDKGLYFEVKMVEGVTYSMDVLRLYHAGVIDEQSIGFFPVKKEVKSGVRYLKEVKLGEGSNVTVAMNPNAKFMGFKSMTPERCTSHIKNIMNFIRNGNVSDDTFLQLELGLQQLQAYSYELGKKSLDEPLEKYTRVNEPIEQIEIIRNFRNSLN